MFVNVAVFTPENIFKSLIISVSLSSQVSVAKPESWICSLVVRLRSFQMLLYNNLCEAAPLHASFSGLSLCSGSVVFSVRFDPGGFKRLMINVDKKKCVPDTFSDCGLELTCFQTAQTLNFLFSNVVPARLFKVFMN